MPYEIKDSAGNVLGWVESASSPQDATEWFALLSDNTATNLVATEID